ncbi:hypothetical protein [Bordetella genomosp. 13]|uniref:Uncharacterized protein n=1 Tax=Bordetella genomosp. 13 TaxID=463040 RepID=A0A1W6Z8X2_9BORD|nr:hypothetical protein [Bordetella genomosp. 13]ARP93590.1 hypothetical protein CAL15_03845 [Bordetella genomosp. 13]
MPIDIEKAVSFIGLPCSAPDLDDFLQQSGQKKRLTSKDRPLATVGLDSEAVQMQFTDSYEETHGPARGEGFLFLEDVTVQNGKYEEDVGAFTGTLPYGLRLDMKEADIVRAMGQPSSQGEFLGAHFLNYDAVLPGIDLIFRLDKKTREITFIRFSAMELR